MFRNQKFNIIIFLLIFFILSSGFYCYIGLVSPGGKSYSAFLDKYADMPAWVSYFICKTATGLLKLGGYDAYQKALNNVSIRGSRGINIIWACLGFRVLSFWVAFVVAHKANWKYKLKWAALGIIIITVINIIRMDLIALGFHYKWETFNSIDLHLFFNVVSYIAIFILLFVFVSKYKKFNEKQLGKKAEVAASV